LFALYSYPAIPVLKLKAAQAKLEKTQGTITATAMQKPIVMQNTMLTPFVPSFLPWDFCFS
jgi:hypothetical protein